MKVLVIVDMQNDFINGSLANPAAEAIVPGIVNLLKTEKFDHIVATRDTHHGDYLKTNEGKHLPVEHAIFGSDGWNTQKDIMSELIRSKTDFDHINKETFGYEGWRDYFCNLGDGYNVTDDDILDVYICGTVTDICVISNALGIKTAVPDANVHVYANLCAGLTPEKHEAALSVMESCQIAVIR